MTFNELANFIYDELVENYARDYKGSMQEYLRSLLAVVQKYRDAEPSGELLVTVLTESFSTPPLPFDEAWMQYTEPGDYQLEGSQPKPPAEHYKMLEHTLFFQIADLKRMGDAGQIGEYAGMGVVSPTGNSWYNFEPGLMFECAISGMDEGAFARNIEKIGRPEYHNEPCDWSTLEDILEIGRIYE
jgi:hypothetical protein